MGKVEQAHENAIRKVDAEMRKLQRQIEARRNIDSVRVDWGHVGDLAHVAELLAQATRFLGS